MPAVSLTTLRTRVRERADMVGSSFVADSATGLDAWINEGVQKLHDMLTAAMGEEYASSSSSFTTVAGQSDYALPSGFYKLLGVDLDYHGTVRTLTPYMRAERNAYRQEELTFHGLPKYSIVGSNLRLYPAPSAGLSGTILYVPEATVLSAAGDTVTFPNGWERYVVLYAAIQALLKEESSVTGLRAELEATEREIERMKEARDYAHPRSVVDMDLVNFESLW